MSTLAAMPKYGAYKESGFQWFGTVPEHWALQRGKWLFLKAERPIQNGDDIVTCFRDGQVNRMNINITIPKYLFSYENITFIGDNHSG